MKYYVTTSIPYATGNPHIGNAIDWLYADVMARYKKQQGFEVAYTAGSDEHGSKIYEKAVAAGAKPEDFVEAVVPIIQGGHKLINSQYTHFARTHNKQHIEVAQILWRQMGDDIYKSNYKGWYCVGCEEFKTETEVKEHAGVCPLHDKKYEQLEEENYFFRLSKYNEQVLALIESGEFEVIPDYRKTEILNVLKDGLIDLSISRPKSKLPWGIPVPGDGTQVMYVWFEALMNYITVLGYPDGEDFKKFWPTDLQIVGKDNLRFHAAIYPAMLLSAGLPVLKRLFVHGHLTVDGKKMSKTIGNIVTTEAVVGKYGVDAFRYFFLRHVSSYNDGDFSWTAFDAAYNNELANELGNAVQRTAAMVERYQDGIIGATPAAEHDSAPVAEAITECHFDRALDHIWDQVRGLNQYIDTERPWEIAKLGDRDHLRDVLAYQVGCLLEIADLLAPFLPDTAEKIKHIFESGTIKLLETTLFPKATAGQ